MLKKKNKEYTLENEVTSDGRSDGPKKTEQDYKFVFNPEKNP